MKHIFLTFILTLSILLAGCVSAEHTNPDNIIISPMPDYEGSVSMPEFDEPEVEIENGDKDLDEEKKKKYYAVATVNSLRIRSSANTSSSTVGYLDKNDAVQIISEKNGFYQTIYKEKTAFVSKQYCSVMIIETGEEKVEKAIDFGSTLLGYPYVWGSERYHWGNGKLNTNFKNGEFDCSAFTQYIYYKSNGAILDVTTRTQVNNGVAVNKENLSRGDLMFFTNQSRQNKTGNERIGHVAIYLGNNYILHTASDHAVIEPISSTRWNYYVTSRRVV